MGALNYSCLSLLISVFPSIELFLFFCFQFLSEFLHHIIWSPSTVFISFYFTSGVQYFLFIIRLLCSNFSVFSLVLHLYSSYYYNPFVSIFFFTSISRNCIVFSFIPFLLLGMWRFWLHSSKCFTSGVIVSSFLLQSKIFLISCTSAYPQHCIPITVLLFTLIFSASQCLISLLLCNITVCNTCLVDMGKYKEDPKRDIPSFHADRFLYQ